MLRLYKAHRPECLKTWVELKLEKEGGEANFTPPGLCVFQPIEHYWADLKGDIDRQYFKGRDFNWIQDRVKVHSAEIGCSSLVRHCENCMNAWIEHDDVLSGTVNALVVPDDTDFGNLQYNAKFLTDEELDRYNHDPQVSVHINLIENEVVAA